MFFMTKKENAAKNPPEVLPVRAPRYNSIARVRINGFEGEAVLRNVSIGGFRMESRTYAAVKAGEYYTMWIQPEAAAGIERFKLDVEVRWIQSSETSFAAGFLIVSAPTDNSYEKYIDSIKGKGKS
jgi:hypothetical protein